MKRAHRYLALGAAAVVGFGVLYAVRPNVDDGPRHGVRLTYSIDLDRAIEERTELLGRAPTSVEREDLRHAALRQAVDAVRRRVDASRVEDPSVLQRGDLIVVELPGLDERAAADVRGLITRTARLEFTMVLEDSEVMRRLAARVGAAGQPRDPEAEARGIEARTDSWSSAIHDGAHVDAYLAARDRPDATGRERLEAYLALAAAADPLLQPGADARFGFEHVQPPPGAADAEPSWRTYCLERGARLDNRAIASAELSQNPQTNEPEVSIVLSKAGGQTFAELTAAHVGEKLAILLDGVVVMAPVIQGAIRGGRISVTLGAGPAARQQAEAEALVDVLRAGSLPAPLREESVVHWGPR